MLECHAARRRFYIHLPHRLAIIAIIFKNTRDGLRFMIGYKIVKGKVEIEPEETAIVRMIFEDYINGMGGGKIAKKLKEMNVPTVLSGYWNSEGLLPFLKMKNI